MKWVILICGILANATASVLIKLATTPPRNLPNPLAPLEALKNWPFWGGVTMFGVALLFYSLALTKLPLNVAHPILTSGAVGAVALMSFFIFGEEFYWSTLIGLALLLAGVLMITVRV